MTTIKAKPKAGYKIKPTMRHKRVASIIADNDGSIKDMAQVLTRAGYSQTAIDNPQRVLQTKGFRQIADEVGLTKDFILKALQEDIAGKPLQRTGELALASKIHGMLDKSEETEEREIEVSWMQEDTSQNVTDADFTVKEDT